MSLIKRSTKGAPLTAAEHDRNLEFFEARTSGFAAPSLAALLADRRGPDAYPAGSVIREEDRGFRYKVAPPAATEHHLTTAGGVKLYVQPGPDGFYPLQAFGAVPDNATDIYDALLTAIYKTNGGEFARIDLGVGTYYCSKTLHLKKRVHLRGWGGGSANSAAMTTIRWPTMVKGIWVNRPDTYAGRVLFTFANLAAMEANASTYSSYAVGSWFVVTATNQLFQVVASDATPFDYQTAGGVRVVEVARSELDAPDPAGRADSSWFEDFALNGTAMNSALTTEQRTIWSGPHGMYAQARIYAKGLTFRNWAGCGVMIYADTSTKVSNPGYYGEASMSQMDNCFATACGGTGFYFRGYDVNACTFRFLDAVTCGRWGLWDQSFLGNTHIGHHISANGDGGAPWGNPNNTGCRVSFGGTYWVANNAATEQQLVDTEPGTNSAVWVPAHEPASGFGGTRQPTWQSGQPVGTYFHGGAFNVNGANAAHLLLYVYTERLQGQAVAGPRAQVIGGIQGSGYKVGGSIRATAGNSVTAAQFTTSGIPGDDETQEQRETLVNAFIGGNSNNIFGASNLTGGGTYRFRASDGVDFRWDYNNGGSTVAFGITGASTAVQAGTGAAVPHLFHTPRLGLGSGANIRRQTNGTAAPTSGAWARGDIVWNVSPAAGGFAGWICTATGTPGTWKTFGAITP